MADALRDQLQSALGAAYTLERELGGGGMSRVFVAREESLGRDVVVKVLSPELSLGISAERFAREIRLAAMLQEPHIVPIHTAGLTAAGLPYFTMPFVSGQSLRHRMRERPVPYSDAVSILRDIARALMYAHSHGIVHRDIKPENVLLSEGTAVVTDFGIAKAVSDAQTIPGTHGLTASGMSIGTPAYMAPEQAAADPNVDHRADIYSWGMIAYELLAGTHAFAHRITPQQLLTAQMSELPPDLRDERFHVPPALAALVMRCLAKDPEERPASIRDILAALEARQSIAVTVLAKRSPLLMGAAVAVVLVIATYLLAQTRNERSLPAEAVAGPSVAVMPFTIIGKDSAETYLADGMTDELASELSKVVGLRVAARRSAFSYRNTSTPAQEIGRALNVGMLLDGTVQRVSERIRVRAQMTNAADGAVLWTDTFEGDARDLFALQDTITTAIVRRLQLTLGSATPADRTGVRTSSEAHDLYMRGRFEAGRHSEAGLQAAIALFEQAVAKDSNYAPPWVGIADAYGWLADTYYDPLIAYPKAKAAVTRAIALAPSLAEAHAVLGWILLAYDWNVIGAEGELQRAVTLDPNSALAHSNYSYVLLQLGRPAQALAEVRRAFELDRLSPALSANLEWHLMMNRQYEAAVEQHKTTKRLDPAYFFADSWAAASLRELKRYDESVAMYLAAQSVRDDAPPFGLAVTYARMGDTSRARAILRQLETGSRTTNVTSMGIAQVYVALGDRDRAFQWLNRAYASRANSLVWLAYWPAFDALRGDPRFAELQRRVGAMPPS